MNIHEKISFSLVPRFHINTSKYIGNRNKKTSITQWYIIVWIVFFFNHRKLLIVSRVCFSGPRRRRWFVGVPCVRGVRAIEVVVVGCALFLSLFPLLILFSYFIDLLSIVLRIVITWLYHCKHCFTTHSRVLYPYHSNSKLYSQILSSTDIRLTLISMLSVYKLG